MPTPPPSPTGPPAPRITRWQPPPRPSTAPCPARQIRITGTLTTDAEYRRTTHGHALLTVYISQGPDAMTWRATQRIDPTPAALIAASAKAHRMCAGQQVTVWAQFVPQQWTPADRHLHLHGVTDITEHQPHHSHTGTTP
jgi:hypothetical protein